MSPSWDSWRNPDSTGKQTTVGTVSPQCTASGDLARSRQHGGAGMLPPLPRGWGCWVNNKLRREEGGTEGDGEERGRKGRGGESTRVRASKETEQWSDSWGYICDDSDSGTHRGKRAHRRTHTRGAHGRGGQRSPLKCSHFSGKKRPIDSLLPTPGRRNAVLPGTSIFLPPGSSRLSPPLAAPLLSLSPLSTFPFGEPGAGASWQRSPLGSWVSRPRSETCREVSPIPPVEKEKLNPSLSQKGIYFRAVGGLIGGPSACQPSKGA